MRKIFLFLILSILIINGCETETTKENNVPSSPILTYPKNSATDIKLDATLNWSASTDKDGDDLKYTVLFGTENPPTKTVSLTQTGTSFTPTLTANTKYYWIVSVTDGKGGVAFSDTWSFTTLNNTPINHNPPAPVLTSPNDQATEIPVNSALTWDASTDEDGDALKYFVILSTDNPPDDTLGRDLTATTFSPSLSQSTTYFWQVATTDGKGGTNASKVRSFTTTTNTNTNSNPPSIPNLLNPSNGSANIPLNEVLKWNKSLDPEGDIVTYNVLFGTDATPTTSVSSAKTDTIFAPTLVSNTLYYWKIIATDATGLTSESVISSFTTIAQNSTKITLN
jgi:hypothetical protein